MKRIKQPEIPKKPSFSWQQHKEFVDWWKEHKESGFVADKQGRWSWNISPSEAWNCARYRGEFTSCDEYYTLQEMLR